MYLTIGKLFEQSVLKYGEKEALVDRSRNIRWSYRRWNEEVNKLANTMIENGIQKGDRISTYLFNGYELATIYFAVSKIGAILNPINFRLRSDEVAYILKDAAPKIVFFEKALETELLKIHDQFPSISFWFVDNEVPPYATSYHNNIKLASTMNPTREVLENDIYAIMYTSGTTGRPKGVMHCHRDMVEQSLICISSIGFTFLGYRPRYSSYVSLC